MNGLLPMFRWLHPSLVLAPDDRLPVTMRLWLAVAGATPVTLVGLATFGVVSLRSLALAALVPAAISVVAVALASSAGRTMIASAVTMGMIATLLYDLFRWSFLIAGWVGPDPIPHIGTGLGLEPGWFYGYLWRYVGNGGGLALVFLALGGRSLGAGVGHGMLICTGLLTVLVVSPHAQDVLFALDPISLFMATTGHLIYGATLGWLSARQRAFARTCRSGLRPSRQSSRDGRAVT